MHHKNIKLIIRKQLKKQYPNWNRLSRKEKKEIAQKVLVEFVADYDFDQAIDTPREALLGIQQQLPTNGIIELDEMAQLVDTVNKSRITKLSNYKRSPIYIKDKELQFVDQLLDDRILNRLLANEGYSPTMRDIFPNNLFVLSCSRRYCTLRSATGSFARKSILEWIGNKTESLSVCH